MALGGLYIEIWEVQVIHKLGVAEIGAVQEA